MARKSALFALLGGASAVSLAPSLDRDDGDESTVLAGVCRDPSEARFSADGQSFGDRKTPQWFQDAKLGIGVHYGLHSLPAFGIVPANGTAAGGAEVTNAADFFDQMMIPDSQAATLYKNRYEEEPSKESYLKTLGGQFEEGVRAWDPDAWAELFKDSGAKYVMLDVKDAAGFCLFDDKRDPHPSRDVLGELSSAVRKANMEMGITYEHAGALSGDARVEIDSALSQVEDIMRKYRPSIVAAPISKNSDTAPHVWQVLANYFNKHCPAGVVTSDLVRDLDANSTFSGDVDYYRSDSQTYPTAVQAKPFQFVRSISAGFGFNEQESAKSYLTPHAAARMLADVVSLNGRLTLDVGAHVDGSLPELHALVLRDLGTWMETNGEAIHGTWPFLEPGVVPFDNIRLTRTGSHVYVIILKPESESYIDFGNRELMKPGRVSEVDVLAPGKALKGGQMPDGRLILPAAATSLATVKHFPLVVRLRLARE